MPTHPIMVKGNILDQDISKPLYGKPIKADKLYDIKMPQSGSMWNSGQIDTWPELTCPLASMKKLLERPG